MKIAVLVKQVPQNLQAKFNPDHSLNREKSVKSLNPADKCALLQAVQLAGSEDEIIAVSMGPASAADILREAVAFGAHRGILLEDPCFAGADTYATAKVLACALQRIAPEIVLCGRRAIDGETGQVGPQIAVRLGMNCLTNVTELSLTQGIATAQRIMTDSLQTVSTTLPVLISVMENLDVTALPSILGLRRAQKAEFERWNAASLGLSAEECGLRGSKTTVIHSYISESGLRHPTVYRSAEEGVEAMMRVVKP